MMKKYIPLIIIAIGSMGLIWSCKEKADLVAPTTFPDGQAYIKLAHFSPNFRQVVNNRDSFNVYVNGTKVNGAFLTYGSIFPSTSNLYATVPAGSQSIRITVNGVNTPDSLTLATFTKTLTAGSYYSFVLTDSLLNSSEAKQIFVKDDFARTDTTHYTVRFVHALMNDSAGKNVDIYSLRQAKNIFTNIAPGSVSTFASQPYNLINDTLIVRRPGFVYELARINTVVFARERAYTLVYKGTPASTAGTKGRGLSIYTNQ